MFCDVASNILNIGHLIFGLWSLSRQTNCLLLLRSRDRILSSLSSAEAWPVLFTTSFACYFSVASAGKPANTRINKGASSW